MHSQTKKAPIIVAVIEELRHRGGLQIALSGRDETSLEPLLNFLIKNAINPRYAHVLLDVCTMVFGMCDLAWGSSLEGNVAARFANVATGQRQAAS
jgi:U3 small nucleolar RNA-associated protein 15